MMKPAPSILSSAGHLLPGPSDALFHSGRPLFQEAGYFGVDAAYCEELLASGLA